MSLSTTESRPLKPAPREDAAGEPSGDRRALFAAGVAALGALLAPSALAAQGNRRAAKPQGPRPALRPYSPWRRTIFSGISLSAPPAPFIDPTAAWNDLELRLVRRITMGLTDVEVTRARQLGYLQYLEYQLASDSIDDSAADQFVAASFPLLSQGVDTLYNVQFGQVVNELTYATVYRGAFSNRQLKERMVEFWTDHFNIAIAEVGYLKILDDRDVIRRNALATFPQLLKASAHSPAMLAYLDQPQSRRGAPNQNYARELMELHTLGVDGGYTQDDVAELSRVLTGWTLAGRGTFAFAANLHDYDQKKLLGVTIPATSQATVGANAQNEGEQMLDLLLNHPSTAKYVSKKMLRFFLRYDPSQAQIDQVAAVYTETGGDIKAILRAVLSPGNLLAAPPKFKRPFHLAMSALRALGPTVTATANVSRQVSLIGQQPFAWPTPDGYPDSIDFWSGNILSRWNFASYAANANAADLRFNVAPWMTPATATNIVSNINRYCFGGEMTPRLREELTAYVAVAPTSAARVRETIALALSSSSFQYF